MNHSGTNSCCQLLSRTNRVASISIPSVFDLTPVVCFFKSTTQLVLVVCWCVNESRTPSSWKVLCSKKRMLVHMYCSSAYCKVVLSSKETNLYQAKHPHTHSHRAHGHKIGLELILKLAMYFFPIGRGNQRKKVKQTNISWLTQPSSPKSSWWVSSELRVAYSTMVVGNKSVCCQNREESTGTRGKNKKTEKSEGEVRVKGGEGSEGRSGTTHRDKSELWQRDRAAGWEGNNVN